MDWSHKGRQTKIQTNHPTRSYLARSLDKNWESCSEKEKQERAIEKPKLDNARNLRGICSIDTNDEEYNHVMKNARKKLEIPGGPHAVQKI